jgi:hypothetical protein
MTRAQHTSERDLREHRKRNASQCNGRLWLLPDSVVHAVVLVL